MDANIVQSEYTLFSIDFYDLRVKPGIFQYAPGTTPIRRLLYRMNEWIWTVGDSLATDDWTKKLEEIQVCTSLWFFLLCFCVDKRFTFMELFAVSLRFLSLDCVEHLSNYVPGVF